MFSCASGFDCIIKNIEHYLHSILFIEIFHIPLIVFILISNAIFYTIRFKFVNIRLFKHALQILSEKSILYCRLLIVAVFFFSSISKNFMTLEKLWHMLFMCLAIPNVIAICIY